ncbi:uncharacterized protein LOC134615546 isoform X1 [Pelobates fuscus]|uniref:uncharacterized protein LOC134615546 isoform X1 n=1 Tax=Pelobates fuscus TaxID=191477 RepID=UPI002FE4A790
MASYSIYQNANFQSFVRMNYYIPPEKRKFDDIKRKAEIQHSIEVSRRSKSATVYAGEYRGKEVDETSQATKRPISPTRMNKPHPPEIFLVTSLHNLPGHYHCEKAVSSETGNGFITSRKHTERVMGANIYKVEIFRDSRTNLAAQAFMKLASEKDCEAIEKMVAFITEANNRRVDENNGRSQVCQTLNQYVKPEYLSSAHQWLLKAGKEERAAVERLLKTLSTTPQIPRMKEKTESTSRVRRAHRSEYAIHPEWRIQP